MKSFFVLLCEALKRGKWEQTSILTFKHNPAQLFRAVTLESGVAN